MSVIVILSDCPPKLKGDMSKWLFEINTGVYVGNISARVRENLWERITENIGHGHATMVYGTSGEQHLDFRVHNAYWEPVDFDGIKLMRRPAQRLSAQGGDNKSAPLSNAAKYRMISASKGKSDEFSAFRASSYVVLGFETIGLAPHANEIIEIGAILVDRDEVTERMNTLVFFNGTISREVISKTGITNDMLAREGISFSEGLEQLLEFVEDLPIVCHNAAFVQSLFMQACLQAGEKPENRFIDTAGLSRALLPDLENHNLSTLAEYFNVSSSGLHRAISDCETIYGIYTKLKEIIPPRT